MVEGKSRFCWKIENPKPNADFLSRVTIYEDLNDFFYRDCITLARLTEQPVTKKPLHRVYSREVMLGLGSETRLLPYLDPRVTSAS